MKVKQSPLTIHVVAHTAPLSKHVRMLSDRRFDNLPEAIGHARSLARRANGLVVVRGRRGNLHYAYDGAAQQPKRG
jgi:hypothetical protein